MLTNGDFLHKCNFPSQKVNSVFRASPVSDVSQNNPPAKEAMFSGGMFCTPPLPDAQRPKGKSEATSQKTHTVACVKEMAGDRQGWSPQQARRETHQSSDQCC